MKKLPEFTPATALRALFLQILSALLALCFALFFLTGCGKNSVLSSSQTTEAPSARTTNTSSASSASPTEPADNSSIKNVNVGDVIKFGNYDWMILAIENGQALLLSKYVLEYVPYHEVPGVNDDGNWTDTENNTWQAWYDENHVVLKDFNGYAYYNSGLAWENCTLRSYLNNDFYNQFAAESKLKIISVINETPDVDGVLFDKRYSSDGGAATTDSIFCLSNEEIIKYLSPTKGRDAYDSNDVYYGEMLKATDLSGKDASWWSRSPGYSHFGTASYVYFGKLCTDGWETYKCVADGTGVRPAMWIQID